MSILKHLHKLARQDHERLREELRSYGTLLDMIHGSNVMEGDSMQYENPVVVSFGSIADHTFHHTNPQGHVVHKDHNVCETDKFGEFSCGGHGGSVGE